MYDMDVVMIFGDEEGGLASSAFLEEGKGKKGNGKGKIA